MFGHYLAINFFVSFEGQQLFVYNLSSKCTASFWNVLVWPGWPLFCHFNSFPTWLGPDFFVIYKESNKILYSHPNLNRQSFQNCSNINFDQFWGTIETNTFRFKIVQVSILDVFQRCKFQFGQFLVSQNWTNLAFLVLDDCRLFLQLYFDYVPCTMYHLLHIYLTKNYICTVVFPLFGWLEEILFCSSRLNAAKK